MFILYKYNDNNGKTAELFNCNNVILYKELLNCFSIVMENNFI